jgi:hypothetical protein
MVGNEVKKFLDNNPFKASDFKGIIHIVDMDGAFAPDEVIIDDPECKKCSYSDTEIRTDSVDRIKKRNAQKREALFRLIGTGKVRAIPYRVYYMSCNMDHVLYDKRNSTDEEKENDAYDFVPVTYAAANVVDLVGVTVSVDDIVGNDDVSGFTLVGGITVNAGECGRSVGTVKRVAEFVSVGIGYAHVARLCKRCRR